MNITRVTLDVADLAGWAGFYEGALGLPVESDHSSAEIRAGRTRLSLRSNPRVDGCHHLAFTIAANKFDAAKRWVAERAEILGLGRG